MGVAPDEHYQSSRSWQTNAFQPQSPPLFATTDNADTTTACSGGEEQTDDHTEALSSRACNTCRQKKRKCTFEKPSCYLCTRSKTLCVYGSRKRKPGPMRGSKRLRHHDLLARIATLESIVKDCLLNLDDHGDGNFVPEIALRRLSTNASLSCESFSNPILEQSISSGSIQDAANPQQVITIPPATLNEALQTHLLEVYFDHIQPAFPLFRRPILFDQFSNGLVPTDLLAVMMALAARFSPQASLFSDIKLDGWEALLNCTAHRRLYQNQGVVDLNVVKREFLVALLEYTRSPGLRAWKQAGVMARAAIGHGLHKIDSPSNQGMLAEDEAEECRFVWWCVWKLDCCFNGIALTPLCIDDRFSSTYLVSTTNSDFTRGKTQPSTRTRLDLSVSGLEQFLCRTASAEVVALETLDVYFVGWIRQNHILRCHMSTTPDECRKGLRNIRSTCSIIRKCLPAWYLQPQRNIERQESFIEHRIRLKALLEYNVLGINSHLPLAEDDERTDPLDLDQWQRCVGFAEGMVELFRCWDVSYDTHVDPMITYAIWYASVLLVIQAMAARSTGLPINAGRSQMEASLPHMIGTLRRFATWWGIAQKLLDSIEQLWKWIWLDIDRPAMQDLVEQLRTPLDPNSPEPTRIYVGFPDLIYESSQMPFFTSGTFMPDMLGASSNLLRNNSTDAGGGF